MCDLDKLEILDIIGRGRYGCVSKGTLNEQTVAVKVFASQYRQHYLNEKDIYSLPFLECHHCLPRLMGSQDAIGADGRLEYHLVLSYAPFGCLQDYLMSRTIDWPTLCRMASTATQGLAYLHSEIKKGDVVKPVVAHRDLSSRNIIIKSDGSCMICDFQFAIRISGSKYYSNGKTLDSSSASLTDVGTLRYLAPEILDGAVNLRDCESALKQIDVYALGLVLWEIASRCSVLYQGIEVPAYKQPFEREVGSHPTFEQMKVLVTRHKARPLFPDIWKDSNPAIRSLKETIEDCWDHDAEARLTALCVENRLNELPKLWERHKSGTLSSIVGAIYSQSHSLSNINNHKNAFAIRNGTNTVHNIIGSLSLSTSHESSDKFIELQKNVYINRLEYPTNNNIYINNNNNNNNNNNTINGNEEPLVTYSPSNDFEKNILSAANSFTNQPKLTFGCQPHQGRNPCLERNLMLESSDDDKSTLLEHGFKFKVNNNSNSEGSANEVSSEVSTTNDNNVLVTNDLIGNINENSTRNVVRRVGNGSLPIPFVQNTIMNTIPKQPNVPGNGRHSNATNKANITSNCGHNSAAYRLSKLFKRTKAIRWPNLKSFRKRNNNDNVLAEESKPFSPVIEGNETNVLEAHLQHSNLTMISSPSINIALDNTEPKATQIDFVNASPLISIIENNDNKADNRRVSINSTNQSQNLLENQGFKSLSLAPIDGN